MLFMKNCVIFGAGDYFGDEIVPQNSFVIAADGGIETCLKKGIKPDLIIGDFDSLGRIPEGENTIILPKIKDDTDMIAAVKEGLKKKCKVFYLYGGTGGRISHTLANIDTLEYIEKRGAIGYLNDREEILTVTSKGLNLDKNYKGYISVFAKGGEALISESGLKYTLNKKLITSSFPLGVSNEFTGEKSSITVHSGSVLVAIQKQNQPMSF